MGSPSIVLKLNTFVGNKNFTEECEVLYFLAEIRKIIEQSENTLSREEVGLKILKMYCDWVLHPVLRSPGFESIFNTHDIFKEFEIAAQKRAYEQRTPQVVSDAVNFPVLHSSLDLFLQKNGIRSLSDLQWKSFVPNLVKILEDQPIEFKDKPIKCIRFVPTIDGACKIIFEFRCPIKVKYPDPDNDMPEFWEFYSLAGVY